MKQKLYENDKRVMLPVQNSVKNELRELLPHLRSDNERIKKVILYSKDKILQEKPLETIEN